MNLFNTLIKAGGSAASSLADAATSVVESSGAASAAQPTLLQQLSMPLMLVGFVVIFYFLMIRPEKKRKKKAEEERNSLSVGDTVISIGGITGEVEAIKNDTITIFTGDGSIDLQKWAIRSVQPNTEESSETTAEETKDKE